MKSFSNEQYRVIDANEDNKLILVDGYAGSGKTILALELARRKVSEGKNVLFLYFNRLIKNKIEDQIGLINETVKDDINSKKISIFTLY
jgi:predicted ribonuclease YlaK